MKQSAFIKALKFASHAMAIKDVRYYLNGVCLELMGDSMILIGTDGHRMAWATLDDDNSGGALEGKHHGPQFIIEGAYIKLLLGMFKLSAYDQGHLDFEFTDGLVTITGRQGEMRCKLIEGKFPDWRRVCKSGAKPEGALEIGVNADYLADAAKACSTLCDNKYKGMKLVFHGANEAMLVTATGLPSGVTEAACVVMPMRL